MYKEFSNVYLAPLKSPMPSPLPSLKERGYTWYMMALLHQGGLSPALVAATQTTTAKRHNHIVSTGGLTDQPCKTSLHLDTHSRLLPRMV